MPEHHMIRTDLSRRQFLRLLVGGAISAVAPSALKSTAVALRPTVTAQAAAPAPKSLGPPKPADYSRLPRWRGFNLLEKFNRDNPQVNRPFEEWDFDFMVQWGFDFVRLPLDYRIWTASPGVYIERPLREIDQVISWARARGIHVDVSFHRAPGYTVNTPKEPLNLWAQGPDGEDVRRQFAAQWRMFAARYRGIPSSDLSFNLVNEPPDITAEQYIRVATEAVEAIRREDPERLIIADGISWARRPVPELATLRIGQSTRGYAPMQLTHFRASWVQGSDSWPVPTWPIPAGINQYLYGNYKREFQSPVIFRGDFVEAGQVAIRVNVVSARANLQIQANGATIFEKLFLPGPGQGEWKQSVFRPEWNIYQNVYDREYVAAIPAGTREIRIGVTDGDWLTFSQIRISPYPRPPKQVVLQPTDMDWGLRQGVYTLDAEGNLLPVDGTMRHSKETLWKESVEPWKRLADTGVGVHVGEWGAHNRTPHGVVLAWMKDCLENWQRANMGWALWNLRGSFGVLDSERADVAYEDYKGHKLDRKMLELLKEG